MQFLIVASVLALGVAAREQTGFCGKDGFDGINTNVPSCMFEAGSTSSGTNYQYVLPIQGITDCSQCTVESGYEGLWECTLHACNDNDPYEPCASATC